MRILAATLLVFVIAASGCDAGKSKVTHQRTILALGTLIEIELYGVDEARASIAFNKVERYLQTIQRDWHAFGEGELGRVNAALSSGEEILLSAALAGLVRRGLRFKAQSDGLFDPTVGGLVEMWGFSDADHLLRRPPDKNEIHRWRREANIRDSLRLVDNTLSAAGPVQLDFGGMAKGTALAGTGKMLTDMGIENALIDAGGDLIALGKHGDRNWSIGIRDPRSQAVLGKVSLASGEAIVTSGDYERYFEFEGRNYHHLLDPRTGEPVTHTAGVTVIHTDPELADAAATALMVAGRGRFLEIANRMGVDQAMLVSSDGEILMTARMGERVRANAN